MPKRKGARGRGRGGKVNTTKKSEESNTTTVPKTETGEKDDVKDDGGGICEAQHVEKEEELTQTISEENVEDCKIIEGEMGNDDKETEETGISCVEKEDNLTNEEVKPVESFIQISDVADDAGNNEEEIEDSGTTMQEPENQDVEESTLLDESVEEVEEVFIDKEVDDDVQYIDEEVDEGEQDLLDVMEIGDNENNDGETDKTDNRMKTTPRKSYSSNKEEVKFKLDEKDDVGDIAFEEISEGSMDPMEQEEVIEAISDNEMITEVSSQDPDEEKTSRKKKRSSSFQEDETLADIFQVTENEGDETIISVNDKDNDDISDASLCDDVDDNEGNLSLEEISEDEFESSKRRKSDGCSQQLPLEDQNKDKQNDDEVENVSDTKDESPVTAPNQKDITNKRSIDEEQEAVSAKRPKLSQTQDGAEQSKIESGEDICVTTAQADDENIQKAVPSPHSIEETKTKSYQKPLTTSRFVNASAQTQPFSRRGKIIQCTINQIGSDKIGELKKDPDAVKTDNIAGIFEKYKSHLPSSVESIFTEVASTNLPDNGAYCLSLGPVTVADFGNTQFRELCLGSAEKFNLSFNSKMQGLIQLQFSKHAEVSRLIQNLKGLDLGNRYLIISLMYGTCQDDSSKYWQALLIFTYNQDSSQMMVWDAKDGKVRSRLNVSGVPEYISKDFVQLMFPEALYISSGLGKQNGRTLTMGFSSTRISKEISSSYELLLFNGEKVEISLKEPILSETQDTTIGSGFIEEDGTVIVQDAEEDNTPLSNIQDKTTEPESCVVDAQSQLDELEKKNENERKDGEEVSGTVMEMNQSSEEKAQEVSHDQEEMGQESSELLAESRSQNKTKDSNKKEDASEKKSENMGMNEEEESSGEKRTTDGETDSSANELAKEKNNIDQRENFDQSQTLEKKEEPSTDESQTDEMKQVGDGLVSETPTTKVGCGGDAESQNKSQEDISKAETNDSDPKNTIEKSSEKMEVVEENKETNSETEGSHKESSLKNDVSLTSKSEIQDGVRQSNERGSENSAVEGQSEIVDDGSVKVTGEERKEEEQTKGRERKTICGKDTSLEDVSDDEMISAEVKAADSDDDVIILKEEPAKQIVANIDLTKESPQKSSLSGDKKMEGLQEENSCGDEKSPIKEEKLVDVDKLTMTDGDLEVVLESIDVEEKEIEFVSVLYSRSGDYRGKYYNSNYKNQITYHYKRNQMWTRESERFQRSSHPISHVREPEKREPHKREPPKREVKKSSQEFSYENVYGIPESEAKVESAKHYERLSSIHSGSSLDDKYSSSRPVASREETAERRDGAKREYGSTQISKSPSPRRGATITEHPTDSFQHSTPAFSSTTANKKMYNYSNALRSRTSTTRPAQYSSYYDYKNIRAEENSAHPSDVSEKSNRSRLPSRHEVGSGWREDYPSQKQQSTRRSKSRSFSPLSPMSVSSNELLSRTSPQKMRKVSHSPISASSRSLSPVSKSPSPVPRPSKSSKYRPTSPKGYRDRYSPPSRDKTDRIKTGHRRSRSPSPYKSWERRRSRSPHYRRRPVSPSTDRERGLDKKTPVSAFRSAEERLLLLDKKPSTSYRSSESWRNTQGDTQKTYDNKIKTMYDNKNSVYKKPAVTKGSTQHTKQNDGKTNFYGSGISQSGVSYGSPSSNTAVNYSVPTPTSTSIPPPNYATPSNLQPPPPQPPMFYSNSSSFPPTYQYNIGMNAFQAYPNQFTTPMYSYMPTSSVQPQLTSSIQYSPYLNSQAAMSNIPPASSVPPQSSGSAMAVSGGKRDHPQTSSSSKSGARNQNESKKHWSMGEGSSTLMFQRILSTPKSKK